MNDYRQEWPVDAHVHFHNAERVAPSLAAAAANFKAAGHRTDGLLGVLLLTQANAERVFETLQDSPRAGDWNMSSASAETETLIARRDRDAIAVVCGRQLRTAEGLEVLALGTRAHYRDGLPLARCHRLRAGHRSDCGPALGIRKVVRPAWQADRRRIFQEPHPSGCSPAITADV